MMYLVKSASTPVVWVLLLLSLGLVLSRLSYRRAAAKVGWACVLFGATLLYLLSIEPVSNWIVRPLEARYVQCAADIDGQLDAVAVLGGGSYLSGYGQAHRELTQDAYVRVVVGIAAFRRSKAKTLIFCGTKAMKPVALQLGVSEESILEEPNSNNTMENAARLTRVLPYVKNRRIGLVTSAVHMRRAEHMFQTHFPEDTIIPIPAHYLCVVQGGIRTIIPTAAFFERSTCALHEWIGILWYSLRY